MIKIHHLYQNNISLNNQKLTTKSQENKMEIEAASSHQLPFNRKIEGKGSIKNQLV